MNWTLTREQVRRHYERHVAKQDRQGWYEDAALKCLMDAGRFGEARAVVEVGCGTGRFAEWLLAGPLRDNALFYGIDISAGMLQRASERLNGYGERVHLIHGDAAGGLPLREGCCDRFIATYLLDLLGREEADAMIAEAHRILEPGGLICLASLAGNPQGTISGLIAKLWSAVEARMPLRVGGCRPVCLTPLLAPHLWTIKSRQMVTQRGVASEIIVARKTGVQDP